MIPPLHTIGRVAGTHGFNGAISIILNEGIIPQSIQKGDFIFISFDGKGVPFLVEQFHENSGQLKICDVTTEAEAAEFEGRSVLLEASRVTATEFPDFSGFMLINGKQKMGRITRMEIYPAGPMLVIEIQNTEHLIPLAEDWIEDINATKKEIRMNLPDGLLNLNS